MPQTVLIVEDEVDLAGLLSDVLHAAGFDVVFTTAGRAAARSLDVAPSAIVMDYLMPGLNGAQVVQQIRDLMQDAAPPVLLVTGLSNAKELAGQVGAAAYLRKPFDMDDFVHLVERIAVKRD